MKQLHVVRNNILSDKNLTSQVQRNHVFEQQGISQSLKNLTSFPWICSRVNKGELKLHGWHFDLNSAELFAQQDNISKFKKAC